MTDQPSGSNTAPTQKRKISRSSLRQARRLISYISPYKGLYLLGLLFLLVSSSTALAFPMFIGQLIDTSQGNKTAILGKMDEIGMILIGLLIVQGVFSFLRIYTFARVSERAMADLRKDLFKKLIVFPLSFFERRSVGELSSRITADAQQLQEILSTTSAEFLRQIATLLIGIGLIFFISPKLTLFMLAIFPPVVLIAFFFGRYIRALSKKSRDALADTNTIVDESLQNISVVKAFTNEFLQFGKYAAALKEVVRFALRTATFRAAFVSFIIFAIFGSIIAVIWHGSSLVQQGNLDIGELTSFILYMIFIGGSIGGLGDIYGQILKALGATERIQELLDEPVEFSLESGEIGPKDKITQGEIQFKSLNFTYPSRPETPVLKHINLSIFPGQQVALAGASGSGKSTIASLLMRFYETEEGNISIDGKPIQSFSLKALRSQIGIVQQEVILFGGSIRDNIAYGYPQASFEAIKNAAKQANALEFIENFPDGWDTQIGERGVKLSGGQRQRIAIARALLKDPKILILDEATSSLDTASEKLVQEALNKLMQGRTTLVIAHRLATIRNVSRIYVLDQGNIVEFGTHDELIKQEGYYSKLVRVQLNEEVQPFSLQQ